MGVLYWASAQSHEEWYAGQRLAAQRAWMAQAHRHALMQQFPFFHPAPDWETALYSDRRAGFTMALPGYPRPIPLPPAPGEPPADALLTLSDLPLGVRFYLGRPNVQGDTPDEIVARQLGHYVKDRAGGAPELKHTTVDQRGGWRVESGATAVYDLARVDPFGGDREEATMLYREGGVMLITLRYAKATFDKFRAGLFRSAAFGSIRWDPRDPILVPPRIWPEGTFLEPGVTARLKSFREDQIPRLAPAFTGLNDAQRGALAEAIERCVTRTSPPWAPVSRAEVEVLIDDLAGAAENELFAKMLRSVAVEVRTMHDLRGFALLMGRTANFAWRAATAPPPPVRPPHGGWPPGYR
jgi:hypothetical protein